jgi:hypothetical protein
MGVRSWRCLPRLGHDGLQRGHGVSQQCGHVGRDAARFLSSTGGLLRPIGLQDPQLPADIDALAHAAADLPEHIHKALKFELGKLLAAVTASGLLRARGFQDAKAFANINTLPDAAADFPEDVHEPLELELRQLLAASCAGLLWSCGFEDSQLPADIDAFADAPADFPEDVHKSLELKF